MVVLFQGFFVFTDQLKLRRVELQPFTWVQLLDCLDEQRHTSTSSLANISESPCVSPDIPSEGEVVLACPRDLLSSDLLGESSGMACIMRCLLSSYEQPDDWRRIWKLIADAAYFVSSVVGA